MERLRLRDSVFVYMFDVYFNKLEHHGIEGQRWGKKNGPPYPLDESDHSAAEKKAKKKKKSFLQKRKENKEAKNHERSKEAYKKASEKAARFKKYASDSYEEYQKQGDKESAFVAKEQIKKYEDLIKKYSDVPVKSLSKDELRSVEEWVKKGFFTDAEYSFYYNGKEMRSTETEKFKKRIRS